jgi:branched-chain amino acid transport system ATP-binding protein
MLTVRALSAGYRGVLAIRDVSLQVAPGEVLAVLGRNGSGRSTLAKALMGLVPALGKVHWRGASLLGLPAHQVARLGLGYVPEAREVFGTLTVHQNLLLGLKPGASEQALEEAYALFAPLRLRQHALAGVLSGGEQQMLSLARTLMGAPDLLIVDEPTEGLAPQVVDVVATALADRRARGMGMLLIEQRLTRVQALADRILVLGRGEVVFEGAPDELDARQALRRQWLEI